MWIDLENIMRSQRSQIQKDKYCVIPLMWDSLSCDIQRQKVGEQLLGAWGTEEQDTEV